jgi:hypothetical protein
MAPPKQTESPYETYVKPTWWSRNWLELATIIGGFISINLIFIAKAYRQTNTINPETAGQLGDFVGGYVGTIFALISVVFLYSTLKSQRQSSSIEKFENKYFELLRLHRDNVNEIGIGKDFGRKIFVNLIRELRAIQTITKNISTTLGLHYSSADIFRISFITLFFGVGPNSSRLLKSALQNFDKRLVEQLEKTLNTKECKNRVKSERGFKFTPFEGHQSRLGHYYRHLYQTVTYVDKQEIDIDKYEYIKTIRAQLSTHEQALLLINCLTPMGQNWEAKTLLLRYRFVQNIPKGFFDKSTEIDVESLFPNDYFEWQRPF